MISDVGIYKLNNIR